MEEKQSDDKARVTTLEHTDSAESFRQLWWTIGVTVIALVVIAYFTL